MYEVYGNADVPATHFPTAEGQQSSWFGFFWDLESTSSILAPLHFQ
jgi:hypothetical protein